MISIWMVVFFFISCSYAAENLPAYNADPSETSVSGLSSGAFFATQMQVAYSASIKGAGIVAGGPYDCAAEMSYTSCMYMSTPPITKSIANTKAWSGNRIDNIENLAKQKVYMFSGTSDTTVSLSVMNQSYNYYVTGGQFIPAENVVFKRDLRATHTFITDFDSPGNNNCQFSMSPYISNCGFDGAGAILQQIYGSLNPRNDGALSGDFLEVNQGEFLPNPTSYGMSNTAWVYVPKVCASNGQTCKVHIAFHGCLQGYEKIGDKFVKNTGFNRWADTNNIIVLYPQAVSTYTNSIDSKAPFPNLNGCWDWIGWYGDDFDVKSGKQLSTMKKMIDRITSGFNPIAAPTNVTNIGVTNSSISLSWNQVVNASGYNVYRNNDKANSDIITNTQFTDINLSSGTTYTYTVKAISLSGGESGPSKSLVANTTGPPPAILPPTGLATADITSDSIGLIWQAASGAKRYKIFRDGNKVGDTSQTSYTDAGLNPATNYTYQVSSVQGSQESAKSSGITATTMSEKVCYVDNNYHHVVAGRATERGGFAFANGSEQNMGLWNIFITTTLCRIKENYYVIES